MKQDTLNLAASANDSYLEEQLISCILNDHSQGKDCINQCLKHNIDHTFFTGQRIDFWNAAIETHMAGNQVDESSLIIASKAKPTDIVNIANAEASPSNIKFYIDNIVELNKKRKLARVSLMISEHAESMDADDLKAKIYRELENIKNVNSDHERLISDTVDGLEDRMAERVNPDNKINLGVPELDKKIAWTKGGLHIVAARPGKGKSAIGAQVSSHEGVECGGIGAAFTAEMSHDEYLARIMCIRSNVRFDRVETKLMSMEDKSNWEKARKKVKESTVIPFDYPTISVYMIDAACAQMQATHGGLDFIVVDYLQILETTKGDKTRDQLIGEMTRHLKGIARKYNIAVICLAQIGRGSDREERRPKLSDLRESGNIEQDADTVMFLHNPDPFTDEYTFIITKQRGGESDIDVPMFFEKAKGYFRYNDENTVDTKGLF